jgi:formylglycine-generating enzyme required for sulfatase activity
LNTSVRTTGSEQLVALFFCFFAGAVSAQAPAATELVPIPAGPFTMGSDSGPDDERPAHRVDAAAFSIDRTPVTNTQAAEFLNAKGPTGPKGEDWFQWDDADARVRRKGERWVPDAGYENHPILEFSWFGASEYCAWVGKRLPTEAEWEKAARGTDGRQFPWGNAPPDRKRAQYNAGWAGTAPVGQLSAGASPYGVLDLSGNAWEWVSSLYRPYPYNAKDGREDPSSGEERVTRGGGQDSSASQLTTTYRGRGLSRGPRGGHHNIGFRCAR